jgi:hypothetical protein
MVTAGITSVPGITSARIVTALCSSSDATSLLGAGASLLLSTSLLSISTLSLAVLGSNPEVSGTRIHQNLEVRRRSAYLNLSKI